MTWLCHMSWKYDYVTQYGITSSPRLGSLVHMPNYAGKLWLTSRLSWLRCDQILTFKWGGFLGISFWSKTFPRAGDDGILLYQLWLEAATVLVNKKWWCKFLPNSCHSPRRQMWFRFMHFLRQSVNCMVYLWLFWCLLLSSCLWPPVPRFWQLPRAQRLDWEEIGPSERPLL